MPSCEKYVHVLLLTIIRFFFKGENISPDETGPPAPPPVPETNVRIGNITVIRNHNSSNI